MEEEKGKNKTQYFKIVCLVLVHISERFPSDFSKT